MIHDRVFGTLLSILVLLSTSGASGRQPRGLVSAQTTSATSNSSSATNSSASTGASSADVRTSIILPPLYSCSPSSWVYTAPQGPKYLGLFISGTDKFIETFALPEAYNDRTNGSFVWNCDLPAGLSVAAMFYVIQDGALGTNGHQTTTPDAIVNAASGSSVEGGQCYGQNDPGARRGILSLASSLDPSFTYTADASSATTNGSGSGGNGGGSSTPVGAIVGGVLGGLALIIVLILLLIYLRRKHDIAANGYLNDGASVYSGWTEKTRRDNVVGGLGGDRGLPPPGTYYATDPEGNTILVMGQPPHPSSSPPLLNPPQQSSDGPSAGEQSFGANPPRSQFDPPLPANAKVPKMTAPLGTLPEPMGDDDDYRSRPVAPTATGTPGPFTPRSEREGFLEEQHANGRRGRGGHFEGLDDPESFAR